MAWTVSRCCRIAGSLTSLVRGVAVCVGEGARCGTPAPPDPWLTARDPRQCPTPPGCRLELMCAPVRPGNARGRRDCADWAGWHVDLCGCCPRRGDVRVLGLLFINC